MGQDTRAVTIKQRGCKLCDKTEHNARTVPGTVETEEGEAMISGQSPLWWILFQVVLYKFLHKALQGYSQPT